MKVKEKLCSSGVVGFPAIEQEGQSKSKTCEDQTKAEEGQTLRKEVQGS